MITGRLTEELIRHFIGYLHQPEFYKKAVVDFTTSHSTKADLDLFAFGGDPSVDFSGSDLGAGLFKAITPSFIQDGLFFFQPPIGLEFTPQLLVSAPLVPNSDSGPVLSPVRLQADDGGSPFPRIEFPVTGPPLAIELTYRLHGEVQQSVTVHQQNVMIDNDILLGPDGVVPVDARDLNDIIQELDALVALADDAVPDAARDPGSQIAPKDHDDWDDQFGGVIDNLRIVNGVAQRIDPGSNDDGGDTPPEDDGGTGPEDGAAAGFLSQNVAMGDNGQANVAEIAVVPGDGSVSLDVVAIDIGQSNGMTDADLLVNPVLSNEGTATQTVNGVETSADHQPAQKAMLGGNTANNAAAITDYTEAVGSIIVAGDYFETNTIVQVNVLADNDSVQVSGGAGAVSLSTDGNSVVNDATFIDDQGTVFGNAAFGPLMPGATWQVDYVMQDFYDISSTVQINTLYDNDISVQMAANTAFTATLGENGLLNAMQSVELDNYDLIVVDGNYYEFNSIIQQNVLLDSDIIKIEGGGEGTVNGMPSQSVEAGGNELLNEAAIVNIGGGDGFRDMNNKVGKLAEAIGTQDTEYLLDYSVAAALPGNGTDTMDVLYVAGDYYEYKIIEQTNVVADADYAKQSAAAMEQLDGSDPEGFVQDVVSGENVEINTATILDVDSSSPFQFLGGRYYEDSLLVQAEYVSDEDTDSSLETMQVMASLMPNLDEIGADQFDGQILPTGSAPGHAHADMLHSMMS
ncbi:hypothetical protein [Oricola sp.]|uniref:hypothetical protein n=1 Tax=Oricola sp. TaxID=1979950 RepID=UPI003BAD8956